jgi:hypothetical protein
MKSLQDYIEKFREVGKNLGYTGQGVEVLVQLLANASYIGEVENVAYMKEASLEKCSLMNSKIQHCVDDMYSVFRGSCPRVVLKIKPTKYLTLVPYQELITSQNFRVYYLGYWSNEESLSNLNESSSKVVMSSSSTQTTTAVDVNIPTTAAIDYNSIDGKFIYGSKTFYPATQDDECYTIIGFLAKEAVETQWEPVNTYNTYFKDCYEDNLSDDMYVTVEGEKKNRTRIFAEHILDHSIFDLTLPNFGSRLYFADFYKDISGRDSEEILGMTTNANIQAKYFKYSELDEYNEVELSRLKVQGAELVDFDEEWLTSQGLEQLSKGLCFINAVPRDGLGTIHYKANRDRYVNSILRSNSDIGVVLEEAYPEIIKSGGTTYVFRTGNVTTSSVVIYYIPINESKLLSKEAEEEFKKEKLAYYVTDTIDIEKGNQYTAIFDISLELFNNSSEDWETLIGKEILQDGYQRKFDIEFNESTINEIRSLINKISNVKKINSLSISYLSPNNVAVNADDIMDNSYFDIKYSISATVTLTNNNV